MHAHTHTEFSLIGKIEEKSVSVRAGCTFWSREAKRTDDSSGGEACDCRGLSFSGALSLNFFLTRLSGLFFIDAF